MTVRNRKTGEDEVISFNGINITYRTLLILLVASVTSVGDGIWAKLGFNRDTIIPGVSRIEKQVTTVKADLEDLKNKVADVHDNLEVVTIRFNKFDVDFRQYQKIHQ